MAESVMKQMVFTNDWLYGVTPVLCGYEACLPGHIFGPAIRSYYLLHYVMKGSGTLIKNGAEIKICAGDIFIIKPEEITTYYTGTKDPWEYCWIGFTVNNSATVPAILEKPVIKNAPAGHLFEQIRSIPFERETAGRLYIIISEILLSIAGSDPVKGKNNYIDYVLSYIENGYMNKISIEEMAADLHINRRYLTQLFKKRYGLSPQEYLITFRLNKARQLVKLGYGVSEIATMTGFTDISNFSHKYKERFGVSPGRDR